MTRGRPVNILALDLSLTSTGWARYAAGVIRRGHLEPNGLRGYDRLEWIRQRALDLAWGCDLVVLEGYSFGSKGNAILNAAELGGVIRMALHDLGLTWANVPPAVLKKYATGKGNAGKELVLVEAVKRLGYEGSSNDEADALWLLQMALDAYGLAEIGVPKAQREALEKVNWPSFTLEAR